MSKSTITLPDLHRAYRNWMDAPDETLQFRHAEDDDEVPTELDVLLFGAPPEDELPESELYTYLATAGMSTRTLPGSDPLVEVVMCVTGRQSADDLRRLGSALADFAVRPFRDKRRFGPNMVVGPVEFPLFENRKHVLLTDWGTHSPEFLPGLPQRVRLLCARTLYDAEADVVEKIGDREAIRRFLKLGVNLDDPRRGLVRLDEVE